MDRVIERHLAVSPSAPGEARRAIERLAGAVSSDRLEEIRLLVSELVTNSVRHAGLRHHDAIGLRVDATSRSVRVEVSDEGPGFEPGGTIPTIYQDSGWGLYLVEQIADRWGVSMEAATSVWFEIDH